MGLITFAWVSSRFSRGADLTNCASYDTLAKLASGRHLSIMIRRGLEDLYDTNSYHYHTLLLIIIKVDKEEFNIK